MLDLREHIATAVEAIILIALGVFSALLREPRMARSGIGSSEGLARGPDRSGRVDAGGPFAESMKTKQRRQR